MPYTKTTWVDDVTPISATNMNKIEQGIFDSTWEKIAEQILVNGVSEISFSAIPSGYKELRLVFEARLSVTSDSGMEIVFNDDTSNAYNYSYVRYAGTPTGVIAGNVPCLTLPYAIPGIYSASSYAVLNISNSPLTTKGIVGGYFSPVYNHSFAGNWDNETSEINKISMAAVNGSFATGSRFALWGCK